MAFEVEWFVGYDEGDGSTPACRGPAYGMTRVIELADYLADVLEALSAEGVAVEQLHPEYAPGQMELSVAATDPVEAADRLVLVKQTIRAVSQAHGLRPSFAPVVVAGQVGNGGHLHLSAWSGGRNLFAGGDGPHGLTVARRVGAGRAAGPPAGAVRGSARRASPATCGSCRSGGPAPSTAGAWRTGRRRCGWSPARGVRSRRRRTRSSSAST